jgi:hypothetical protein
MTRRPVLASILVLAVTLGAPAWTLAQSATPAAPPLPPMSANASVYATGLDNPRGLVFGPDGALYVAEGGAGGTTSTVGQCDQVVPPIGPYTGGKTARISKIAADGTRATVVDKLPSSQTSAGSGALVSGVAAVAFVNTTLYAVLSGAGCSHGVADAPNAVLKVNADGTTTQVADVSAFVKAHPVAKPNAADFEPDETTFSMIASGGMLYLVQPNHGELDKVDPASGIIARVVDISASQGHVVPTVMAIGPDGNFYISNLDLFPVLAGDASIYKITPDGNVSVFVKGLTAVVGLAFDAKGQLYALEMSGAASGQLPFAPGTGRVVRVEPDGSLTPIATGLMLPTGMTVGPDGNIYVSNFGFGAPAGAGQIVKVDLSMPLPAAMSGGTPMATPVS